MRQFIQLRIEYVMSSAMGLMMFNVITDFYHFQLQLLH